MLRFLEIESDVKHQGKDAEEDSTDVDSSQTLDVAKMSLMEQLRLSISSDFGNTASSIDDSDDGRVFHVEAYDKVRRSHQYCVLSFLPTSL